MDADQSRVMGQDSASESSNAATHTIAAVTLVALTPEADACLGHRPSVTFTQFPIRIGRESRAKPGLIKTLLGIDDRRQPTAAVPNNDLYLFDDAPVKHISREHLRIDWRDGEYWVTDRGSACGTVVGEHYIGGGRTGASAVIHHDNVLIVGTPESPYVFRFVVS